VHIIRAKGWPTAAKLLAFGVVWLLAFAPAQALAGDPMETGAAPAIDVGSIDHRTADAIEFRSEFGFPSDAKTVSALLSDPTSDYSFGAPLSPEELANLQNRLELREKAEPAVAFVDGHPDDFGGLYFTQNTGELTMVILPAAKIASKVLDEAVALLPDDLTSQMRTVTHSMTDLEKAERDLELRWDELQINEVGIQVADNGLDLVLASSGNAPLANKVADVPVDITVGPGPEDATCTNSSSCWPYRGGIGIYSPGANQFCTWGFYGTRGTSAKYMITAGHCANLGDTETHEHDASGNPIVVTDGVDRNTFDGSGSDTSDAMTAHVKSSTRAVAPFNTIYASGTDKAHAILATKFTTQHVGDLVCFMGGATGTSLCGSIEATGLSYNLTRETDGTVLHLTGQVQMSRVVKKGDSGGPVYKQATAWGIVNAIGSGSHMLYSTIASVQSDIGTTVCVTNAC
jgi:hypothetical protein